MVHESRPPKKHEKADKKLIKRGKGIKKKIKIWEIKTGEERIEIGKLRKPKRRRLQKFSNCSPI